MSKRLVCVCVDSPSSRRMGEWEPGKVRRRAATSRETERESSSSSLPRSRSNSHSGGNKHSATGVQDSGFSTETSSKDCASTAIPRPQSPSSRPVLDEAEDELWNLLDVIHRKGVRLREEVESLQGTLHLLYASSNTRIILERVSFQIEPLFFFSFNYAIASLLRYFLEVNLCHHIFQIF